MGLSGGPARVEVGYWKRLDEEIAVFDGGGAGGFDMSDLLAQAQAMQNQLMEAQANLESQEIEGSAGGGLVTALVSGTGELLSLSIKQEAVDPDDTETLADLIVAAVRDASENAKEVAARAMGPLAGGIPGLGSQGPGLPGGGSAAPVGFSLPGAGTVPGETSGTGSDEEPPNGTSTGPSTPGPTASGSGADGSGIGFVNPGSGTGSPGQNPG